jgi:MarR family 2-MHQ and catechol resistance regulon transcriptional repressor
LSSQVLSTQVPTEAGLGAWVQLLRAHAAVTRELSARLEAGHGLTLSDFDVLVQLYFAEGRRLRRIDLARQVLLTASGITRLLDGLERAGWVDKERCDSDARVTYAVLTEAGLERFEKARASHMADIDELFSSRFTPQECEVLRGLLGRLPLADTACSE